MSGRKKSKTTRAAVQGPGEGYRVLARKYRPRTFDELIGQDAMVRTLANAFETGRIAQAYMLTGVRGVGKTTTARLIARALNYTGAERDQPSLKMDAIGDHCEAILESRHIDVLEMDAASHTGIDDVREIIEAVRYKPASARYRVYIIDEVHMLSRQAFNGLLKTLEEPPPHVKFIFATTEVPKVPVTVLSRCQRFDLRRVDGETLGKHLTTVAGRENVEISADALAQIVRASEGSVRDALSILDQAIAHDGDRVSGDTVRAMLAVADRGRIADLFEHIMGGATDKALGELENQYFSGVDPLTMVGDLADYVHWVTRLKMIPGGGDDPAYSPEENRRGQAFARTLGVAALVRAWQILLKGLGEVRVAPDPAAAADMLIVRLAHVSDLPAPDELVRQLTAGDSADPAQRAGAGAALAGGPDGGADARARVQAGAGSVSRAVAPQPARDPVATETGPPETALQPSSFEQVVALARAKRDIQLTGQLERSVRVVDFRPGQICVHLVDGAPGSLANDLARKLGEWTGERWMVTVETTPCEDAAPTLAEQRRTARKARIESVRNDPLVAAVLETFPGAEIVEVRDVAAGGERASGADETDRGA